MSGVTQESSYEAFCIARQPIIDRNGNTYGYELLFRNGADKTIAIIDDQNAATIAVATCGFLRVQESVDQSKRLFINFTEQLLLNGAPRALPSSVVVIEVLEDIQFSPELFEALIALKQEGYLIAIDDFDLSQEKEDLLQIADIVKVDVLNMSRNELRTLYSRFKNQNIMTLAEKVDNQADYQFLHDLGFDYFQGYFFAHPENLSGRTPKSSQISKLNILSTLNSPTIGTDELVSLVNSDPTITYRLLRLLNSAAFGFSMKIESARHAIVLLGLSRMQYWLRLSVLSDLSGPEQPTELFMLALSRGKILEGLAEEGLCGTWKPETLFLFGILSLLDVMLDTPFDQIVKELPILEEFRLCYTRNEGKLAKYLALVQTIEDGNFTELFQKSKELGIALDAITSATIRSNNWIDQFASEFS